jgi:hypothetical protein
MCDTTVRKKKGKMNWLSHVVRVVAICVAVVDSRFERGIPSLCFRCVHACWACALWAPATIGVCMSVAALTLWNPQAASEPPAFHFSRATLAIHLWVVLVGALVLAAIALAHLSYAMFSAFGRCRWHNATHWIVVSVIPVAAAPAVIHSVLPWEDPYDGSGSPTAGLLGLIILGVVSTIFAMPGFALLLNRRARKQG